MDTLSTVGVRSDVTGLASHGRADTQCSDCH